MAKISKKTKLTLELTEEQLRTLQALGETFAQPDNAAQAALEFLITSACDGIRRPGSWERQWVVQAFGNSFEKKLEPHDDYPQFNQQVRRP